MQAYWRMLSLDGIHFSVRHGDKADAIMILVALGVDLEGNKEVLARRPAPRRAKMDGPASCKSCVHEEPPTWI